MKAVFQHRLFQVQECWGDHVELLNDDGLNLFVPYGSPALIIDPTDGDLDDAAYRLAQGDDD